MSNKVFEEAIADAKKLREVAEENAKKAILEAVTPKIREFIESELLEGSEEEVEETEHDESSEVEEEVTLDEASLKKLSTLLGVNITDEIASDNAKSAISESTREAFDKLDEAQKKELKNIANKINSRKRTLSAYKISNKESNLKENSQMKDKYYEVDLKALREAVESELSENLYEEEEEAHEGADEDASLEEMLQELRLVLDLGEDIEEDQVPEELRGMLDLEDEEDEEVDLEDEEDESEEDDEADAEEDDDAEEDAEVDFQALAEMMDAELDEDEMVEVDEEVLAEEILRIRKMVREGKMDHQFGGKGETKAGVDGSFGGKGSGKAGVKKSFGGGAEGQDAFVNPPTMNKLAEAFRSERRKNRALDEKLKKYRSAVNTLREQLEDLNLFNAKLLYVNKLLQNKNLNESEKKSVIKALDEANSLREAKSLYKSLTETFTHGGKKTLAESRNRGSSSRTTTSSASKVGAPELDRWSRLAGLTK
tara:strand:+ start:660 stop:2108 length:1449 start_codon:yes stop_codon:yes gene_type:complete